MAHPFDRYAPVTDLKALLEWTSKPLRKSMRVNTLKCSTVDFLQWTSSKKWKTEPVPWCPEGFFIDREDRGEALGKDLLHVLGHTYMQEAASMLPVVLLDPQPGENILDMSAAPGSKTTQIAARMKERGVLVANDVQEKRLWSLITNLYRCGVINSMVTRKVGQWFASNMSERFDRVLCDAPCTAQGTARKDSDALKYCSDDNIGKMARLQRELLESAVHACKVGGRIVYSTCTLTPEENEDVVRSILNKFSTQLVVIDPRSYVAVSDKREAGSHFFDAAIEDSERAQKEFSKDLSLSASYLPLLRLWPQTYDTEGFFCAVIEKIAPTKPRVHAERGPMHFEFVPGGRIKKEKERLIDWYGVPFLRDREPLLQNKEQYFITTEDVLDFVIPVQRYAIGLPFGKSTTHGLTRIAHETATLRGIEATKQTIDIKEEEIKELLRGGKVNVNRTDLDNGDVLIATKLGGRRVILGRGLLKDGSVLNRLPREIVAMFT